MTYVQQKIIYIYIINIKCTKEEKKIISIIYNVLVRDSMEPYLVNAYIINWILSMSSYANNSFHTIFSVSHFT